MNLGEVFSLVVPAERGVGFRAYDGSSAGPVDAEVIIEGVETEAQLDLVKQAGAYLVQGYFTGRPETTIA